MEFSTDILPIMGFPRRSHSGKQNPTIPIPDEKTRQVP